MDRQLAERMVGAACLLAVLVLVVPAILDGNPDSGSTITHPVVEESIDLRTHTIRLDGAEREPPVPMPVQARTAPDVPTDVPADAPVAAPPPAELPIPQPDPSAAAPEVEPDALPAAKPARSEEGPPASVTAPAASGRGDWIVQLGSFSRRDNAERLVADLRRKGFSATVEGGGGSSGTLFRVRAGPEPDRKAAEALAGRLATAGFKGGRVGRK